MGVVSKSAAMESSGGMKLSNGVSNGHSNGVSNGHSNGVSNGKHNGISNGHSNGVNGHSNGTSHDLSNGGYNLRGNGVSKTTKNGLSNGVTHDKNGEMKNGGETDVPNDVNGHVTNDVNGDVTKNVSNGAKRCITWSEVRQHGERADPWLVIDGEVYDVTRWMYKHPGGRKVLTHYAGQDASEAFQAFHKDMPKVTKYMKAIHVGSIEQTAETVQHKDMTEDMEKLRQTADKMGFFEPSVVFYTLSIAQLIALEAFAYWVLCVYGTGWIPWSISLFAFATLQVQCGWIQHDFGHLSVFKKSWKNHLVHQYTMGFTHGFSADWWNHLHYQHHAKPNVIHKDPDVRLEALLVLGETMPKKVAQKKKKTLPYDWQHRYFFATLPPLLFPIYFQLMNFRHCFIRKQWFDVCVMTLFYVRFYCLFGGILGFWSCVAYYFIMRIIESHWFVWVSQSNHIPMEIEEDLERPWLSLQLHATCNIQRNWFNDWFTGHLNHQIEHHLFPTMPRHNLYKIAPLCESLCAKHNIPYTRKPLLTAFADIIRSLEHSGQIWSMYYHAYNF